MQDLIWVSDFQTFSEDQAMPEHVKEWLLGNSKKRFRTSSRKKKFKIEKLSTVLDFGNS